MSTEKSLNGLIDVLEIRESTDFVIQDKIIIKGLKILNSDFVVNFELLENASLVFGNTINVENIKGKFHFISDSNTSLNFHLGIHAQGDNEITLFHTILGNSNKSEIKIRVIAECDAKILLKNAGELKENTKDNEFLEDIKYLNEYPGSITCLPELFVSSNEVVANHNMTVGVLDEELLFYLQSKGIFLEKAKELIRESFIKSMIRKE